MQRGEVVVVNFTAVGSSNLSESCTTALRVLAVDTPDVCDWSNSSDACELPPAALGRRYDERLIMLRITGVTKDDDVTFRARNKQGMLLVRNRFDAEVSKNIVDANDQVRLQLSGTPSRSGSFAVIASSGGTQTMVNGRPLVLNVLDCLDKYDSCLNGGKCKVGSEIDNKDGRVDCDCATNFFPGSDGRCSETGVPLTVACPCDLQLASERSDGTSAAPKEFWEAIYADAAVGGSGGEPSVEITRSDSKPVAGDASGDHSKFDAGSVTRMTLTATSADGRSTKSCQVSVGVVHVESAIKNDLARMKGESIPENNPITVELRPKGVVPGYDVTYHLQSKSVDAQQVSGYEVANSDTGMTRLPPSPALPPVVLPVRPADPTFHAIHSLPL